MWFVNGNETVVPIGGKLCGSAISDQIQLPNEVSRDLGLLFLIRPEQLHQLTPNMLCSIFGGAQTKLRNLRSASLEISQWCIIMYIAVLRHPMFQHIISSIYYTGFTS